MSSNNYRPDIDGLRAVAIIPVVLYHAGVPGPTGGFIGVDVFFVISGYLITSIVAKSLAEGNFSLIDFYERRARRILPALLAMTLATCVVGWLILLPSELESLGASVLATAFFVSNIYFLFTLDYFARAAEFAPLLHTWSLAVEEQFYLFFPLILMAVFKFCSRKIAALAVVILSVISLFAALYFLPKRPDLVFYFIAFRAWELGIGSILALVDLNPPKKQLTREILGFLGILLIFIPIFLYSSSTPFPGLAAVPPVLGAALLIMIGVQNGGSTVSRILSHPILVWVGLVSYSLYLWHWPILAFLRISYDSTSLPFAVSIYAVLFSFLAAWISWRFIERPFRGRSNTRRQRHRLLSVSLLSLLAFGIFGGVLSISNGFPHRVSEGTATIAAVALDHSPLGTTCLGDSVETIECIIGTGSPENDEIIDFLFWGDSHANAMRPGMDLAASNAGRTGLFAGSIACLPIRELQRVPENRNCTRLNENVWELLHSRTDMQMIILAGRWPLSVEGTRHPVEGSGGVELEWVGAAEMRPDGIGNAALFEGGLRETVLAIRATGREVILLGAVPEIPWDVPAVSARGSFLGWSTPDAIRASVHTERAGRAERILREIADDDEGVQFIPLDDLFCDSLFCRVTGDDGLPLYVDDDHVSRRTAEALLAPRFSEIWED